MTDWRAEIEDALTENDPAAGGERPFGDPEPWEDDAVNDYLYPDGDES